MSNQIPGPDFLPKDWHRVTVYGVFLLAMFTVVSAPGVDQLREFLGGFGFGPAAIVTDEVTPRVVPGVAGFCASDGNNQVKTAGENSLNASLQYQAPDFKLIENDGNVIYDTGTGTAGATLTYTSLDAPCDPRTGKVYAVASASLVSAVGDYAIPTNAGETKLTLDVRNSGRLIIQSRYITNLSTSSDKGDTITETNSAPMSSGDTRQGYFDVEVNTSKSQYGGPIVGEGALWVIDTVDSAAFTDNAISLGVTSGPITLTTVNCATIYPRATSQDSANRCYVSDAIKASDGIVRIQWKMSNDGGSDAGGSSDPILYVENIDYGVDDDGTITFDAFTSSGSNIGESQTKYTWSNE